MLADAIMRLGRIGSVALVALLAGCPANDNKPEPAAGASATANEGAASKSTTKAPPKPSATIPEIVLPPGDGPAAIVGGVEVPREVFNREYKQTLERYYRARHDVKPPLMERLKDNIVRRLIDAELIRQQAKALGVKVDEAEFAEKWKKHKERYGSEEGFKAFLERAGTTSEDVERQFHDNLLREQVFQKVSEGVKVDAKEVKAFYEKNEKRYQEPEKVKASHVLIKVPPNASEDEVAKAKARIEEAKKKLQGGTAFEQVAKEYSMDNTKDRGGDLGFFIKGRMVKPFEEAAWKAKVGKVVGPVKTQFGWHLIKKTDHVKARKRPFSEVKDQIARSLEARQRNQTIRESLETWRKETKIDVLIKGDPKIISSAAPPKFNKSVKNIQPKKLDLKGMKRRGPDTSDQPAQ